MRIGANMMALTTHKYLTKASKGVAKSSGRLSSGMKINSAADDPSGLAIGTKLRLQSQGIGQANVNSANGVSLIQTAEGAFTEIHAMLQRIRELAVAAANDTNETDDRKKMQDEIDQLMQEIDDTAYKTEYNKIKLLSGEVDRIMKPAQTNIDILRISDSVPFGELRFQYTAVPTKATYTPVAVSLPTTIVPPAISPEFPEGIISINGQTIVVRNTIPAIPAIPAIPPNPLIPGDTGTPGVPGTPMVPGDTIVDVFNKIKAAASLAGLNVVGGTASTQITSITSQGTGATEKITITGDTALLQALGMDASTTPPPTNVPGEDGKAKAIFTPPSQFIANATASFEGDRLTIKDVDGREVVVDLKLPVLNQIYSITTSKGPLILQVGQNMGMEMYMSIPKVSAKTLGVDKISVMDHEKVTDALEKMDKAIGLVSEIRSKLGAYQNRLEHTIANLDNAQVDADASASRVMDTDMAAEMTEYSKNNVIYQAGISILAQANQWPQAILQLLQ